MCSVVVPLLFFWAAPVETTTSVEYIVQVKKTCCGRDCHCVLLSSCLLVAHLGSEHLSKMPQWGSLEGKLFLWSVTLQFEWFSVFILSSNLLSQIHLCDRLTLLKSQETQDRSKGERNCQEQETQRQADWKVWRSRGVVKARQGSQKQVTSFLRCFPGIVFTGKPPVNRDALEI